MEKHPGRNDPCPCGSGKKFKRCHGLAPENREQEVLDILRELPAVAAAECGAAQRVQGEGNPLITLEFHGQRIVAVRDTIHFSSEWKTFHDFLSYYIKVALGPDWGNAEIAKPLTERHPILQWYDALCHYQAEFVKERGKVHEAPMNGAANAYLWLAYDLYSLNHNLELQDRLLHRLRSKEQFAGARHEVSVAATLIRGGFDLEFENEDLRGSTHCEFTATSRKTGRKFSVECKCRNVSLEHGRIKLAKLGRKLRHALEKQAKHTRMVFIELNVPGTGGPIAEMPGWLEQALRHIRKFEGNVGNGGDLPPAYLFLTNHPHHYDLSAIGARTVVLGEGFKFPEFKHDAISSSLREAAAARDLHIEAHDLLRSMKRLSSIPASFDKGVPRFAIGPFAERFRFESEYLIPDHHGNDRVAIAKQFGVNEQSRAASCLLVSGGGVRVEADWPLTAGEFADFKADPERFVRQLQPPTVKIENPLGLYDHFLALAAKASRDQLLEEMAAHPDIEELRALDLGDLRSVSAERRAYWVMQESARRKQNGQGG